MVYPFYSIVGHIARRYYDILPHTKRFVKGICRIFLKFTKFFEKTAPMLRSDKKHAEMTAKIMRLIQ